jgi:hypothetical protein
MRGLLCAGSQGCLPTYAQLSHVNSVRRERQSAITCGLRRHAHLIELPATKVQDEHDVVGLVTAADVLTVPIADRPERGEKARSVQSATKQGGRLSLYRPLHSTGPPASGCECVLGMARGLTTCPVGTARVVQLKQPSGWLNGPPDSLWPHACRCPAPQVLRHRF